MLTRIVSLTILSLGLCGYTGAVVAQAWSPEQQEVWKLEEQQWQMAAAKDLSWMDTMVHPNLRYWETGEPMPRDKASLKRWGRHSAENSAVLVQELFPISITVTGNVAVVQYHYMVAREDLKKERETVTGQYTDVLVKENGRWLFLTWSGGDYPKK